MNLLRDMVVLDLETLPISNRPRFPPIPVGIAIRFGGKSKYLAFNHINGKNNATYEQVKTELTKLYNGNKLLCFHNAKFDLEVISEFFDLPYPQWSRIHDTLPLLFLKDPRATTFSLKPSAEAILGEPPTERDDIEDWLLEHQPIAGIKLSKSKDAVTDDGVTKYVGAYVSYAPVDMVASYAIGDVDRTFKLFEVLYPEIQKRGMEVAYDRERRLLPHILEMEKQGIRVDTPRLQTDYDKYGSIVAEVEAWLFKRLKCKPFNVESGQELAEALVNAKVTTVAALGLTATGKMATNKDALKNAIKDKVLIAMLAYRSKLITCLEFMGKWLKQAVVSGGYVFTTWNSTRVERGKEGAGARTGRISSTPNMQNTINIVPLFAHEEEGLPKCPMKLPPLPVVRSYIIPENGHVLIQRDWSQQEPRILAHYCGGALLQMYLDDPWVDFHDQAKVELENVGLKYARKIVKNFNLGTIYGQGIGLLAEKSGLDFETAKKLKGALQAIYPGLKEIYREMRLRAQTNTPIRTWGGREYFCEPPKIIKGKLQTFDYKLPNCLIQGSAGDSNKESMIRFCEKKEPSWRLILTIHDEMVASVPLRDMKRAMALMKESMEVADFDVPMLSEGKWSEDNFAMLKDYDKRGVAYVSV